MKKSSRDHWDVIVIGSGVGGLTAATALSNLGKRVLVLEQHYLPGGWTHTFALEGYKFSPGVHYVGQLHEGGTTREIFEGLGVGDDIEFVELNPDGYDHIVFDDETFDIPKGREVFRDRLIARFPAEEKGIRQYFSLMQKVDRGIHLAADVTGLWSALKLALRVPAVIFKGLKPAGRIIDSCISDSRLKTILESRAGDHGVAPCRVPFALHVAIDAHYWEGGWYPKGGGGAIPKAYIKRLQKNGSEIRTRTNVQSIILEGAGGKRTAAGVRLENGEEIRAEVVLSNADAWITYKDLVGEANLSRKLAKRVNRLEPSVSALSLFIATDIDVDALGLDSGNYWIMNDTVDATYDLAELDELGGTDPFPGAFLTVTTKKDPQKQYDGVHTMEAFVFVSYAAFEEWQASELGERPDAYDELKQRLTNRMLATLERVVPNLSDHLVLCELGTPLTNVHYVNAYRGNIYATAKTRTQIGPGALPIETEIEGLFHCGQSTTAHGILGAMMTGVSVASRISGCDREQLLSFADAGQVACTTRQHVEV